MNIDGQLLIAASNSSAAPGPGYSACDPPPHDILEEIQPVIDGLVEQVALVGCDGIILAVNDQWRRQVERQARSGLHISRNYDAFLTALVEEGDRGAEQILLAFRDIRKGLRERFSCIYTGSGTFNGYDFRVVITALRVQSQRFVLVSVHDVTELTSLKRQKRRFGSAVLRAQEHERRRMARDLHDSTGQAVVALQLQLLNLSQHSMVPEAVAIIAECKQALKDVHKELRSLAFIAHPPSLEINSLSEALKALVAGFGNRTGLELAIEISGAGQTSRSVEATIYRLTQEALANIHRHAAAAHAFIRLVGRERYLHLLIADDGVGFDKDDAKTRGPLGVGLSGMVERVRDLGGRLSIRQGSPGTILVATLPRR